MINSTMRLTGLTALCTLFSAQTLANMPTLTNPNISVVLDGYYQTAERPLSENVGGFGLDHTELSLSSNIDDMFYGKFTTILEVHDGDANIGLEEAFIQTLAMPAGLSIRAGRFLSDVGYLNSKHMHTDSFVDRPAVYRAFLGEHYFDDGARLSYLAPTNFYWLTGVEAFKGDQLNIYNETSSRDSKNVGVYTAFTKIGSDIGVNSSWQAGLSYLRNENGIMNDNGDHGHAHANASDEHNHAHGAEYTGENMYIADLVYKWAPNGNFKHNHLTLSGEYFRLTNFKPSDLHHDDTKNYQDGWYVSSVYQFTPHWSAGVRYGQIDTQMVHGHGHGHNHEPHFIPQTLKETDVSIAWHHSHFSTVRLQYTNQRGNGFDLETDNIVTLQYVMTFGDHGAHEF